MTFERSGASGPAAAAIDCGTVSARLLIGGVGRPDIVRTGRVTHLGESVSKTRRLAPEAIARTVETLREYRRALDEHGVTRVRAIATSAIRDATNGEEFLDAAEQTLGL